MNRPSQVTYSDPPMILSAHDLNRSVGGADVTIKGTLGDDLVRIRGQSHNFDKDSHKSGLRFRRNGGGFELSFGPFLGKRFHFEVFPLDDVTDKNGVDQNN